MDRKLIREGLFTMPEGPEEKPHLIGSLCERCQEHFFPKRAICPNCLSQEALQEVPLSTRGTLYTYSVVRAAPQGFEAPYVVGYVDLPEGIRLFAPIGPCQPSELKMGMEVELSISKVGRDSEGNPLMSYEFRPTH